MKRIIACSDGTWNTPKETDEGVISPTNVSLIHDLIASVDTHGIQQVTFYDEGVGTDWYDKISGGLFGMGINRNIIQAYQFIANYYVPGDEIYLFGFSRGAYTARSLAGFIRNSGLLRNQYISSELEKAFLLYKRRDDNSKPDAKEAIEFRKKYCFENVRIKFIGIWDTVGELGIPIEVFDVINRDILNCQFYDVELSSYVDNAYHALAIDEHRKPFLPTLWKQQQRVEGQQMEQQWFAGVHRDVGGGYNEHELSDCALRWIIEKANDVGLAFKDISPVVANPLGEMHDSMSLLYKIFGSKDRTIGNGPEYNETIAPSVIDRINKNIDNYTANCNPFLTNYISKNMIQQKVFSSQNGVKTP